MGTKKCELIKNYNEMEGFHTIKESSFHSFCIQTNRPITRYLFLARSHLLGDSKLFVNVLEQNQ